MMLARFVDAFTDVAMGRICDKSKYTHAGKFKPWILRMCGPVAVASFLIYQSVFKSEPLWFKVIWLAVTYILWGSVFYTSINIPYGSMASAISAEPRDRQSLSTFRTMGATLAGVIIGAGVPLLVYEKESVGGNTVTIMNGEKFTLVAGVLSALSVAAYLICYALTTERIRPQSAEKTHTSVKVMLNNAIKNRALLSIIVASVVMLLAQLTLQQMANYVYPNYYGNAEAMSASTIAMMLGMLIAATIARPLTLRFGKAEISAVSNGLAGLVCLLLFFIRPENVWVYIAFNFLSWLGLGVFSMVSWALITDVIDYSELKNGVREDGSIYALYSFARKLGQAASSGLVGALLSIIGYNESTQFNKPVLEGIYNISTLIPSFGFITLGLILWFWYPLHKRAVDNNVAELKRKHGRE